MFVRRVSVVVLSLFLVVAVAPLLRADATTEARKAVQAAYDQRDAAAAKKDAPLIFSAYAPDYVGIDPTGKKHTLAEMKAAFPKMLQAAQSIKAKTVIQKFSLKGKEAMATVKSHSEIVLMNPQTQKPATLVIDSVAEETWAKSGKTWLKKLSRMLSQKRTVDGKPA